MKSISSCVESKMVVYELFFPPFNFNNKILQVVPVVEIKPPGKFQLVIPTVAACTAEVCLIKKVIYLATINTVL